MVINAHYKNWGRPVVSFTGLLQLICKTLGSGKGPNDKAGEGVGERKRKRGGGSVLGSHLPGNSNGSFRLQCFQVLSVPIGFRLRFLGGERGFFEPSQRPASFTSMIAHSAMMLSRTIT